MDIKLRKAAQEYIDILNSGPNAWGQHTHPKTGEVSHSFLLRISLLFGKENVDNALKELGL